MVLIFIISLYFGIKSALNKNSFFDKFTGQLSLLSFAMPSFYLALLGVLIFAIKFEILPPGHAATSIIPIATVGVSIL